MAKARNPIAELCAIAAMPGIEDLAQERDQDAEPVICQAGKEPR